ncbi:hypothetical protein [Corallococcus macrosporus]|uniref:Uncharacterized protein n=1 Tax=Corallococcus macrosporus DSM 14697 TaxID=1189310 RepID=A0A250K256_9BACT|nr:hypothetical protein [Corallococcus macrosporus]ATB50179.1 hypothetical protein MYMAC_005834 [Corallococcus macrosporus DSM 14697]
MKRAVLGLIAAVVLNACAAHEKTGDRAAAVGDWKAAYTSYRQALASEPDSPEIKSKFESARTKALQDAQQRAQTCAQVNDWGCALAESDFALSVEPGNAEIASFRAHAAQQVAMGQLDTAAQQAQQGQYADAAALMDRALQLSPAPEVKTQADGVRSIIVTQGRAQADRHLHEGNFIAAHELAQLVLRLDGSASAWAQHIANEYEHFITEEVERLSREGDAARAQHDWNRAQQSYAAALSLRQGGRAQPLEEYVRHMALADQRIAGRDWNGAADAYHVALRTGQDDGFATHQLERVQLRPYRFVVHSILVTPGRPDGRTWVGPSNDIFVRLANRVTQMVRQRGMTELVKDLAMSIPHENRPRLRIEVHHPDGMHLTTQARNGIYSDYEAEFVAVANAFDDRRVGFQVYMDGPHGSELLGSVDIPVHELVERRDVALEGASIMSLRLSAVQDGRQPGPYGGMAHVVPAPPPGAQPPPGVKPPGARPPPPGRQLAAPTH